MTSSWTVIDTGKASAQRNMALDEELLSQLDSPSSTPILHLYDWEGPCATYGHFINPCDLISKEKACDVGLSLARRPTGGGMIFHVTDWAFSILVPAGHPAYCLNVLENYAFVNRLVIDVVGRFCGRQAALSLLPEEPLINSGASKHFCMAKPTRYDVMLDGRKVGGGAQRRKRQGFLHQGTISLVLPSDEFLDALLCDPGVKLSMRANTLSLLPQDASHKDIIDARMMLSHLFRQVIE